MAGGEGSRLRPLTSRRPKPLVPVVGAPIMEHTLGLLRDHGITQVVVTVQYMSAEVRNYFGDGGDFGMEIEYVVEDEPLGTAGSVGNARHLLDDTFLVISGDSLTDIDIGQVVEEHRARGAAASIALCPVPNPLEFGVVVTDRAGAVRRFLEKPSWSEVFSDQANTGIYVVEPDVLGHIEPGTTVDWSQDVFPAMMAAGEPLYGASVDGYWCDVGTVQTYMQANWDALAGKVRCRVRGQSHGDGIWIGEGVEFGLHVRLEGPAFIGDECKIKAGAWLNGPVVVDKYSVVDDNAKVSNSVLWQNSYVGERARLRHSVVCRRVTIKNDCLLEDGSVVGDECVIGPSTRVGAGVKIWPHKDVQPGSRVHESIVWAGEWRRGLFSSYGISGLINVELTPEFCARLGAAFAATLPKGAVVAVTRDHSRSARMIKRALVSGIVSAGAAVRDLGELPVPLTQFATRFSDCAAGVHVVESPLDKRSADILVYDGDGVNIGRRTERKVENLFYREDFRRAAFYEVGAIGSADPLGEYCDHVLGCVDVEAIRAAGLKVLVDYDYSAASLALPSILDRLAVTAIPLHAGFGEAYRPRPAEQHADSCREAALVTRTVGAHAGWHMGATGERVTLLDDLGGVLDHHEALAVLAGLALAERPGAVVTPASVPWWVEETVRAAGGRPAASRADPGSVLRATLGVDAVLGADGLGGYSWSDHLPAFDGIYTVVKTLELLARSGRTIGDVRATLLTGVHVSHTEFCPWEAKGRVMRMLLEEHRDARLDLADGMKVLLEDGWVLVRPDPDSPHYHIVVSLESDADRACELLSRYTEQVLAARGDDDRPGVSPVLEVP